MSNTQFNASPAVSIIVPVYKVEAHLRQCVDSLLGQSYRNIEIILIDDGSPDKSGKICDAYASSDSRVKVIHQKNQGVSAARNAGIEQATGKWITFVDGDDWLEMSALEALMEAANQNSGIDLISFSFVLNYEEKEVSPTELYPSDCIFQTDSELQQLKTDILEKQSDQNSLRMAFCKLIHRDILMKHNIRFNPDIPLCEDSLFWFEAFHHISKAFHINRCFYHYRQNAASATYRYRPNICNEHDRMLAALKQEIDKTPIPEIYAQGYYLKVYYAMQTCITQYFYHKDNPAGWRQRHKACRSFFRTEPYRSALKQLRFSELTRNHRIKLIMLKLRLYGIMNFARNLYFRLASKKLSE